MILQLGKLLLKHLVLLRTLTLHEHTTQFHILRIRATVRNELEGRRHVRTRLHAIVLNLHRTAKNMRVLPTKERVQILPIIPPRLSHRRDQNDVVH